MSHSSNGSATAPATDLTHVRAVADLLPQLVWSCRPDGRCDYLSRRWVEYTGVPEAEHHGTGWLSAVHPDDRDATRAAWRRFVDGAGEYDVDYRLRRRDGAYRWFKTRGALVRDPAGAPARVFGTTTDVDDQKRAEAALRDSERRFREMADTAPVALWLTEADGRCTFLSREWYELTGQAEALGLGWTAATHPDDRERAGRELLAATRRRRARRPTGGAPAGAGRSWSSTTTATPPCRWPRCWASSGSGGTSTAGWCWSTSSPPRGRSPASPRA